jgi:hypothetical protein
MYQFRFSLFSYSPDIRKYFSLNEFLYSILGSFMLVLELSSKVEI